MEAVTAAVVGGGGRVVIFIFLTTTSQTKTAFYRERHQHALPVDGTHQPDRKEAHDEHVDASLSGGRHVHQEGDEDTQHPVDEGNLSFKEGGIKTKRKFEKYHIQLMM